MPVTVRLFGRLRGLLGRDELSVPDSPGTVGELIALLGEQYDTGIVGELLDEQGNIDYAYAVFVAGQRAQGADTPIHQGQEVAITSMIAGGCGCCTAR